MRSTQEFLKILTLMHMLEWASIDAVFCPRYCECHLTMSKLRHVRCVEQKLISVELGVPKSVQWLELSYNLITALDGNVFVDQGLDSINELNLDHNAIQSIDLYAFNGLNHLQFLDLSYNHLHYLHPGTFETNSNLVSLNLQGNPLRQLDRSGPNFLFSVSLEVLNLSDCRLNYIPSEALSTLPSLVKLNVTHNNILGISKEALFGMKSLKELDISNTGIRCNEEAAALSQWGAEVSARIVGFPCLSSRQILQKPQKDIKKAMHIKVSKTRQPELEKKNEKIEVFNNEWNCEKELNQLRSTTKPQTTVCPDKTEKTSDLTHHWLVWLAFVNGLVTGASLSVSVSLMWVCCQRRKRRRRNAIYTTIESGLQSQDTFEAPPPSYSELF